MATRGGRPSEGLGPGVRGGEVAAEIVDEAEAARGREEAGRGGGVLSLNLERTVGTFPAAGESPAERGGEPVLAGGETTLLAERGRDRHHGDQTGRGQAGTDPGADLTTGGDINCCKLLYDCNICFILIHFCFVSRISIQSHVTSPLSYRPNQRSTAGAGPDSSGRERGDFHEYDF